MGSESGWKNWETKLQNYNELPQSAPPFQSLTSDYSNAHDFQVVATPLSTPCNPFLVSWLTIFHDMIFLRRFHVWTMWIHQLDVSTNINHHFLFRPSHFSLGTMFHLPGCPDSAQWDVAKSLSHPVPGSTYSIVLGASSFRATKFLGRGSDPTLEVWCREFPH